MKGDLTRLLRPRTMAVVGGGAWCRQVVFQARKLGFEGEIWAVHPKADQIEGAAVFRSVEALPGAPDATFIGINREATIEVVRELSSKGAGGVVCFASGFREAQAEDASGADLQDALLDAAGDMPILGPNCYGFINYLDAALLWPDQHGGTRCERGVALITQSSNIAINLTMQSRGLPIAYVVTAGNQAQTSLAEIGLALLEDPRVTALGLHIEGIGNIRQFETLAARAAELKKPIVAIKVGASDQAKTAAVSHTASLAGQDAGANALLKRLGVARVHDVPTFLETLKLVHLCGQLPAKSVATISCSGGEASLAADMGLAHDITFPNLNDRQIGDLRNALGPRVALANPLDYHTYIWRDVPAMTRAFASMADPNVGITILIVDFPRADVCDPSDWDCTIEATINAKEETGAIYGMAATLPELMPESVANRLLQAGVVPFSGLAEAFGACAAASEPMPPKQDPVCLPHNKTNSELKSEADAKSSLARYGLRVPKSGHSDLSSLQDISTRIGFPQVLKGGGVAHKTELGAVRLGLKTVEETVAAAHQMPSETFLVEEMIEGAIVELLIGVVNDPAHGFVLTVGAGGTLTEVFKDSASLLVPASDDEIEEALQRLQIAPLLTGYRGAPAVNMVSVKAAVRAVQEFTIAHQDQLQELEINPLICTSSDAIAADALLRLAP